MIESTILAYAQSIKKQHYSSINNQNLKKFVKSIFLSADNVKTFKTKIGKNKERKGTNQKKKS